MATQRDWVFLRDTLRSLDKKVEHGEVVAGPPWDLPQDLTGEMAADYLEAAKRRFDVVEKAVKDAWESPIVRVQNAGRDVGSLLREGAKRAAKIARDLAHATAEAFEQTYERMEKSGESIATGLGIGAGVAIIVALLFLRELKG
jgi:tetrahydromethanopterin S-methyltransferase subunit G